MTLKTLFYFSALLQTIYGLYIPNNNACGCSSRGLLTGGLLPGGFLSSEGLLSPGGLLCSEGVVSSGIIPTGLGGSAVLTSLGGDLTYSCISPFTPTGVSIVSELAMMGPVLAQGAMPFFSAVAFESAIPTIGSGIVAYGCGDGFIGIDGIEGIGSLGGLGGINGIDCGGIGAIGGGIGGIGGVSGFGYGGINGGCGCL